MDSVKEIVTRMEERQKQIFEKIEDMKEAFHKHAEEDRTEFTATRAELKSFQRFCTAIAIVAGAIGYIWAQ